jgi:hypothetical protein
VEQAQIWVRSLDSLKARPMPGTKRAYSLFWSTDSRFIFFWADRKLKKIAWRDGPPQVITEFSEVPWTGFSLPNGDLILNTNMATYRVTNAGIAAVVPNKRFSWPEILPDGDHVLYRQRQSAMTWIGSLESNKTGGLIETDTRVEYAPPLEGRVAFFVHERSPSRPPTTMFAARSMRRPVGLLTRIVSVSANYLRWKFGKCLRLACRIYRRWMNI